MKKLKWTSLMVGGLLIGLVNVSQARVRAWIVINPFPLMVASPPVVVAQPVEPAMVPDPYAPPPLDYGRVLNDFHNRVRRLQRVLDRQLGRGVITQGQYDRHADDLDGIVREEQQDAARHNGALTPREINELNRRLTELQDRIHEDIAR